MNKEWPEIFDKKDSAPWDLRTCGKIYEWLENGVKVYDQGGEIPRSFTNTWLPSLRPVSSTVKGFLSSLCVRITLPSLALVMRRRSLDKRVWAAMRV